MPPAEAAPHPGPAPAPSSRAGAISVVMFCLTSVEHAVATWLPTFGSRVGSVDAATMAVVTGVFWGTIAAGRVGWSILSSTMASAWPVIFFDGALMLASSFLYLAFCWGDGRVLWLLWLGTIGLGFGISSGFASRLKMPSALSDDTAPSAALDHPEAQAAPTHSRASWKLAVAAGARLRPPQS